VIYLLDTSAVSDWMNEHPAIVSRLSMLSRADRGIVCSIVRGEILYGIRGIPRGKRRRRLEERATKAFAQLRCEAVPGKAGDFYAQVRFEQERKGLTLDANDLWIAATTLALNATLVSRDGDFGRIDAFPVEDWTK
jgi:predicted nucleic acid-binding protein